MSQKDSQPTDPKPHHKAGELMRVPKFGANNKKIGEGIYPCSSASLGRNAGGRNIRTGCTVRARGR